MEQRVQIPLRRATGVLEGGAHHLGSAPAPACPGEKQQGAVALANERVVARRQQLLQRLTGEGVLTRRAPAPLGIRAARTRHQHLHRAAVAWIRQALRLMRFR
ncbi:hypothetical protein D3C87_1322290 [compost metagenome]